MFCNILVCVDGSPSSDRALSEAIDMAVAQRSRLTLLTSIQRPPCWVCTPATAAGMETLAVDLARESAQALEAAVDRVPRSVPVTKILSRDPIRDALTKVLRRGEHDLLVLGSRGRGSLSAAMLGSVGHYALHHADVPVLIMHADPSVQPETAHEAPTAAAAEASIAPAGPRPAAA